MISIVNLKVFFLKFHSFLRERKRAHAQVGEGQREGDTESKAGFRFWAVSAKP